MTKKVKEKNCLKKIISKSRKDFLGLKDFLERRGDTFLYTSSGTVNSIIYNNTEWISVDLTTSGSKGHHLNRTFKRDIDSWLEEHGAIMPQYPNDYKEQFFNLQAIEANMSQPCVLIDINDCYWRTAYMLGYITQETYIGGLKRKEWKEGRNACIGSMRKLRVEIPYVNGKRDLAHRKRIPTPIQYHWIRNHIIGHVYQMFYRLFEEIGDNFFMFLTDCVVTNYKSKAFIEKYFAENGYKSKSKPVEFTRVDRSKKTVYWFDFKATNDNGKTGVERYYRYADGQLIGGTTNASLLHTTERINKNISIDNQ